MHIRLVDMGIFDLYKARKLLNNARKYASIINTTTSIDIYFKNYQALHEVLIELANYKKYGKYVGTQPIKDLAHFLQEKPYSQSNLIERMLKVKPYNQNPNLLYNELIQKKELFVFEVVENAISTMNDYSDIFTENKRKIAQDTNAYNLKQDILRKITTNAMVVFEDAFKYQLNCHIMKTEDMAYVMLNMNNQYVALTDIYMINQMAVKSIDFCPNVPNDIGLCTEDICFSYPNRLQIDSLPCSYLEYSPFTQTFKYSRYPIKLHFSYDKSLYDVHSMCEDCAWGTIEYFQDGTVGKAELIRWVKQKLYIFKYKTIGTTLVISKITTKNEDSTDRVLYKIQQ